MGRSKCNNNEAKRALKEKEAFIIRSFHDSAVNVLHGRFFTLMSKTLPDPRFYNDFFNEPPKIDLNELIYRRPSNRLINMMMDASKYAHSKIRPLMDE